MFLETRLFIKRHFPDLYCSIRQFLLPMVIEKRSQKALEFKQPQFKTVSYKSITFSIWLDPKNGFVDEQIFISNIYEPDILDLILKHLPQDGTFVDIGANIGQHSLFAATYLNKDRGQVISFEPIPKLVKQLEKSIESNNLNNITLYNLACSDKVENAKINLKPGNIGGSSIHLEGAPGTTLDIKTALGDDILHDFHRIDLIKIDTEGHELSVLKGLRATLERNRPSLIIEFSPDFWGKDKVKNSEEFFSLLTSLKYLIYDIESGEKEITDPTEWLKSFKKVQTNLLCISKR